MALPTERRERDIEAVFNKACQKHGGVPRKFTSPGHAGVLDRIVLWPKGKTSFAEIKKPGGRLSPGQRRELELLTSLGHLARVIYDEADIARFIADSLKL